MAVLIDSFVFEGPYVLESIQGLGVPPMRVIDRPNPGAHGSELHADYYGSRPVTLGGNITGDGILDLKSKLDIIAAVMTPGLKTLTIHDRIVFCKPAGSSPFDYQYEGQYNAFFQANFIAADPLIYSSTEHSGNITLPTATGGRSYPKSYPIAYGTISTGGVLLANNAGNIAVNPTIVIYGPVDNPRLRNVTQGLSLELAISLGATDTLTFDFKNKTIMLNGTASRYSSLTVSDWWDLSPGNNELSYAANTYQAGSYALVSWRDGYLTA